MEHGETGETLPAGEDNPKMNNSGIPSITENPPVDNHASEGAQQEVANENMPTIHQAPKSFLSSQMHAPLRDKQQETEEMTTTGNPMPHDKKSYMSTPMAIHSSKGDQQEVTSKKLGMGKDKHMTSTRGQSRDSYFSNTMHTDLSKDKQQEAKWNYGVEKGKSEMATQSSQLRHFHLPEDKQKTARDDFDLGTDKSSDAFLPFRGTGRSTNAGFPTPWNQESRFPTSMQVDKKLEEPEENYAAGQGDYKISGKQIKYGFYLVKGKVHHPMEDRHVVESRKVPGHDVEVFFFSILDGHGGHLVAEYLQVELLQSILAEPEFLSDTLKAIKNAYLTTDDKILKNEADLGVAGSTAVTVFLIANENDGIRLVVANVGDSRAVICKNGKAEALTVDHEPDSEKHMIEEKGGFVSHIPGDIARVDGQLAVSRAFGDINVKEHLSAEPHMVEETIDESAEFLILASDGVWKVIQNQDAVDLIKGMSDPRAAAKKITLEAVSKKSRDDISCIVVFFK